MLNATGIINLCTLTMMWRKGSLGALTTHNDVTRGSLGALTTLWHRAGTIPKWIQTSHQRAAVTATSTSGSTMTWPMIGGVCLHREEKIPRRIKTKPESSLTATSLSGADWANSETNRKLYQRGAVTATSLSGLLQPRHYCMVTDVRWCSFAP